MATLSAVLATTHHPFFLKATELTPPEERMPQAAEWKRKVEAYRETLTAAKPDLLVMVGADHFHQFFADNYPTFLIGKQPKYDATYYNEEREFSIPRFLLDGDEDLSGFLLQGLMDRGFDLSVSHELKLDHSIICPIITTRPQADLPVVPIYTNIFAPPMPSPKRFWDLGRAIREVIDEYPSDQRIAADRQRAPLARARRPAAVRRDRPRPGVRPERDRVAVDRGHRRDPRERHARVDVGQRQRDPRLHGPDPDDGHRRPGRRRLRRPASTSSTRWRPTSPGTRTATRGPAR